MESLRNPFDGQMSVPSAAPIRAPKKLLGTQGEVYAQRLRRGRGEVVAPSAKEQISPLDKVSLSTQEQRRYEDYQEVQQLVAEAERLQANEELSKGRLFTQIQILCAKSMTSELEQSELNEFEERMQRQENEIVLDNLSDYLDDQTTPQEIRDTIANGLLAHAGAMASNAFWTARLLLWMTSRPVQMSEIEQLHSGMSEYGPNKAYKGRVTLAHILEREGFNPKVMLREAVGPIPEELTLNGLAFEAEIRPGVLYAEAIIQEYLRWEMYDEALTIVSHLLSCGDYRRCADAIVSFASDKRVPRAIVLELISILEKRKESYAERRHELICTLERVKAALGEKSCPMEHLTRSAAHLFPQSQARGYLSVAAVQFARHEDEEGLMSLEKARTAADNLGYDQEVEFARIIRREFSLGRTQEALDDLRRIEIMLGKPASERVVLCDTKAVRLSLIKTLAEYEPRQVRHQVEAIMAEDTKATSLREYLSTQDVELIITSLTRAAKTLFKQTRMSY